MGSSSIEHCENTITCVERPTVQKRLFSRLPSVTFPSWETCFGGLSLTLSQVVVPLKLVRRLPLAFPLPSACATLITASPPCNPLSPPIHFDHDCFYRALFFFLIVYTTVRDISTICTASSISLGRERLVTGSLLAQVLHRHRRPSLTQGRAKPRLVAVLQPLLALVEFTWLFGSMTSAIMPSASQSSQQSFTMSQQSQPRPNSSFHQPFNGVGDGPQIYSVSRRTCRCGQKKSSGIVLTKAIGIVFGCRRLRDGGEQRCRHEKTP